MNNCPYCEKPMGLSASQPRDERLVGYVCPICSWQVVVLRHPPAPPVADPVDVSYDALCELLQTVADAQVTPARVMLPVALYLVGAVEALSTARDRADMRRRLADYRRVLADQLADLIPDELKQGGAL